MGFSVLNSDIVRNPGMIGNLGWNLILPPSQSVFCDLSPTPSTSHLEAYLSGHITDTGAQWGS